MLLKSLDIDEESLTGGAEAILSSPLMGPERILSEEAFITVITRKGMSSCMPLKSKLVDEEFITRGAEAVPSGSLMLLQ